MGVIDWIKDYDPSLERLVSKYLLDEPFHDVKSPLIESYLKQYDPKRHRLGEGFYSPKWRSSHYTLLELKYLEIDPKDPIYLDALTHLVDEMWDQDGKVNRYRHQDLCVVAMMVSLLSYQSSLDERLFEMMDYILLHQMPDGGFNCQWETKDTKKSSVHTTLTVLEMIKDYEKASYLYRIEELKKVKHDIIEVLLKRHLFKTMDLNDIIHKDMMIPHYPPRWKYDILRALEAFVDLGISYDIRMKDALDHLKSMLKHGKMPKGPMIPGLIYHQIEDERYGRFNTYRMLKVLKAYEVKTYQDIVGVKSYVI